MSNNNRWAEAMVRLAEILAKTPLEHTIKWGADTYTYNCNNVVAFHGFNHFLHYGFTMAYL